MKNESLPNSPRKERKITRVVGVNGTARTYGAGNILTDEIYPPTLNDNEHIVGVGYSINTSTSNIYECRLNINPSNNKIYARIVYRTNEQASHQPTAYFYIEGDA